MKRELTTYLAVMLTLLSLFTGCHPTQPFYMQEDGDLSHYLDRATQIDQPDYDQPSLDEVTQSHAPITLSDFELSEHWDLTLEECVAIALQNSKVIRTGGGIFGGGGGSAAASRTLSISSEGLATVYDPAVEESSGSPVAHRVDGQGNRVSATDNTVALPNQFHGVEDALSEFDAQFFSAFSYNKTDRPRNTSNANPFNPAIFQANDSTFLASLSKRTATGAIFTLRGTTTYSQNNIPIGIGRAIPSDYTQVFETEWTQPLLRNRGTQVNRIPLILARTNMDISLADFESNVRNFVLDVENAYWDLFVAYRQLESAKKGRDSAHVTWKNTEAKRAVSTEGGEAQAEAQARNQYYEFDAQVKEALTGQGARTGAPGVLSRERALRFMMGIASTDKRIIRPIDEPTLARVQFQWHDMLGEALFRSPDLRRQKWKIKQQELQLISARNQLLPELNVSALYRWVGIGDELITAERRGLNFPTEGSTAFDELTEGDYQEAGMRVNFTPPTIGARRQRTGIRNAELRLAREKAVLEDKELALVSLLSDDYVLIDHYYHVVQSRFQQWIASSQEVESLEALAGSGKAPIDIVLDAQRRRADAQFQYYFALGAYNKQIARVHYQKGSLLEYNNIALAEGPWPNKAYWDALGRARERDASYYLDYGWTRPNVISRGEVPQQGNVLPFNEFDGEIIESGEYETIETPGQPTPADAPAPLPMDVPGDDFPAPMSPEPLPSGELEDAPGPVTRRPTGPALNAPSKQALSTPTEFRDDAATPVGDPGIQPASFRPRSAARPANPLR